MFTVLLVAFTTYLALDTFVITRVYTDVTDEESSSLSAETEQNDETGNSADNDETENDADNTESESSSDDAGSENNSDDTEAETENTVVVSENSYSDGNITITITEYREYETSVYVADILLSSPEYLQTAFAQSAYGRNVTEKTSEIAESAGAILAINGDYYGSRESGYVLRNGVLYRSTASSGQEDLVIYEDGSFEIISEDDITAEELLADGAVQIFSFGPALVSDGSIAVTEDEEVGKAKSSNPRTAIGIIDELHYVFVVSDGRTDESAGLSLSQLAEFMAGLGVTTAYNLDGGGSSTLYFNGEVINNPTTDGRKIKERSVSDIVYIGY